MKSRRGFWLCAARGESPLMTWWISRLSANARRWQNGCCCVALSAALLRCAMTLKEHRRSRAGMSTSASPTRHNWWHWHGMSVWSSALMPSGPTANKCSRCATNSSTAVNCSSSLPMTIAWTAKEAVIKAERNSAIDWTEGIRLEPFVINPDETKVIAHCGSRDYRLVTRMVEEHYITLATPMEGLRHGVGQ